MLAVASIEVLVARYKVYAATNTLQMRDVHTPPSVHIGDTQFSVSVCEEQALLGARADRVAERRKSPRRYRIDDREAPLQRQVAWEEPGQAPGRPPGAPPLETASMDLETGIPGVRERERFVRP
jgi:hypothetical protein